MKRKFEIQTYIPIILERLKQVNPKLIIIFGSAVSDNHTAESDLDILIVLNINKIPATYDEKLKLKLAVRKALYDINEKIPIDILVFTIPEYEGFIANNSSFSREIEKTGKIIYEKAG